MKKNIDKNNKFGFTLMELLAVIVILAVILVIAVPKVMNIINDINKSTFAASVKVIASGAEKRYAENKALGNTNEITCKDVAKLSSNDYKLCEIAFEQDTARVTLIGSGKFEGLSAVYASKTNAVVQEGEPERLYTFDDVYEIVDKLTLRIEELETEVKDNSDKIENLGDGVNSEELANLQNQINSNATSISNLTDKDNSNNIFLKMYPVGSIYVTNESTNPGSIFGGTWVTYGEGRTQVGVDSTQTEFASVGLIGGEKTHTLTRAEMPSHRHDQRARVYGYDGWDLFTPHGSSVIFKRNEEYYLRETDSVNSATISMEVTTGASGTSQPPQ